MFRLAIIGRPNVGKSTLFNKLVGKSFAITSDVAGTTRDRKEHTASIADLEFVVIDTAGLEQDLATEILAERMLQQTSLAISGADACLFLVDAKSGILPADTMFANWLRKLNKPTQLVVNKAENFSDHVFEKEFYKLGFGKPVAISAEHKLGFDQLYYFLAPLILDYEQNFADLRDEQQKNMLQIAIIGRPNAGKSSLLNHILQQDRLLTGPEAGITEDLISVDWQINGNPVRFIDTAGIRKKTNISQDLEKLSVLDSYRAIRFSQVVILLIDANTLLDHQDVALAGQVLREGRALIFAINKIDTVQIDKEQFIKQVRSQLQQIFAEIDGAPILGISAKNGYNVKKLLDLSWQTFIQWQTYLNTSKLCIWLQDAVQKHQPKLYKGINTKLKYATQIKSNPPTIAVFTNHIKAVVGDYQKYLVNSLREYFNLKLTPIRLVIRKSDNPFANKKKKLFLKKLMVVDCLKKFGCSVNFAVKSLLNSSDFVPQIDENYLFDPTTTSAILAGFVFNQRVLVQGMHGTGKSTHIEQVASRLNWPLLRINFNSQITRLDLVGKDVIKLKNGKQITEFQEGIIPFALRNGIALVLDEYDAIKTDVSFVIQRLLEEEGKFSLLEENEIITPHPNFRLFATSNTLAAGDDLGIYHGTNLINQAQIDRLNIVACLNYLSPEHEIAVLQKKTKQSNLDVATIKLMVKIANSTQESFKNGDISTLISLELSFLGAKTFPFLALSNKLLSFSFYNKVIEDEKPIIAEFYQRIFAEEI